MASSSAMTTRVEPGAAVGTSVTRTPVRPGPAHPVPRDVGQQLVLATLQVPDRGRQGVVGPDHGVGVPTDLGVLVGGQRGLGDQRAQSGILGLLVDHGQLLVQHGQLLPGAHQPGVDVADPAFEQALHVPPIVGGVGARPGRRPWSAGREPPHLDRPAGQDVGIRARGDPGPVGRLDLAGDHRRITERVVAR